MKNPAGFFRRSLIRTAPGIQQIDIIAQIERCPEGGGDQRQYIQLEIGFYIYGQIIGIGFQETWNLPSCIAGSLHLANCRISQAGLK